MNSKLQEFARQNLKEGLSRCTDGEIKMFKRMYAPGAREGAADLNASIEEAVDKMPAKKLDWAMEQVERTLAKHAG